MAATHSNRCTTGIERWHLEQGSACTVFAWYRRRRRRLSLAA
ncbi:MAG: hypothetical protein ACFCU4_04610 [Puniceicoccaceae bacterium]